MDVIDWPGIRAAAVSIGIRAAARSAASNLPPVEQERFVFRVLKRAAREGWEDARLAIIPSAPAQALPLSSNILTGSDVLKNQLNEDSNSSKIGFSKAARKAAEHLADQEPAAILKQAQAMLNTAKAAALIHSWQGNQPGSAGIHIGVLTGQVAIQYTGADPTIPEQG